MWKVEICRKRGMLLCGSLCTDSLDHGGYDGDAANHVCCVPWAISQGLRLRDAGRDSLVYNKGQRIFIRHEPNPCPEKICHHICGHAALYSNYPGGLASKAADELSIASVTRGIENPNPRTCLVQIKCGIADWTAMLIAVAFFIFELCKRGGVIG